MAERFALQHIDKRFGSVHALEDVDFVLHAGQVHALLGENGAGKTTLMRIAYGLTRADLGTVRLNGVPVAIGTPRDARALGIGMVHQHFTSVPELSVGENVALAAGWPVRPTRIRQQVTALCRSLDLPLDPDAPAGALPVALQQRLEIVKALAVDTTVLLMDEPTAVLTPAEVDNLLAFLRRFAAGGGSVALITHKLPEVLKGADRVTVLRHGRVTYDGSVEGHTADTLTRHMIGDAAPEVFSRRAPPAGDAVRIQATGLSLRAQPGHGTGLLDGSLDVRAGEIVGLAAVEGNGQRELLRCVAGVWQPSSGTLAVAGDSAFVPEDRIVEGLIPDMTVTENVVLALGSGTAWVAPGRLRLVNWTKARHESRILLEDYGIVAPSSESPVGSLSGGNQQKLVLARALVSRPEVLVAENPTRGLDIKATADIHARLRVAADQGTAVVFYSSDLDEVLDMADRVVVVANGKTHAVEGDAPRSRVGRMMLVGPLGVAAGGDE
jgi:simple sugar transport system ATP-binding protein